MKAHQVRFGGNQTWLTPQSILDRLGGFDLDPCAAPSPRPWATADKHIELPEDGLAADGQRAPANSGASMCLVAYGKENSDALQQSGLGVFIDDWQTGESSK